MAFVSTHTVKSYTAANPNRDMAGRPKQVRRGKFARNARSSQNVSRCTGKLAEVYAGIGKEGSIRTHFLPEVIAHALRDNHGHTWEDAVKLSRDWSGKISKMANWKKVDSSKDEFADLDFSDLDATRAWLETKEFAYCTLATVKACTDLLVAAIAEPDDKLQKALLKKASKALWDTSGALVISHQGRMVASDSDARVEAATSRSWAVGVGKESTWIDDFVAVDDLMTSAGAGHLGSSWLMTATMLGSIHTDVPLFHKNMTGGVDDIPLADTVDGVTVYHRANVDEIPNAMSKTTAPYGRTPIVITVVTKGQPLSLDGAFNAPVQTDGNVEEETLKCLDAHIKGLLQMHDHDEKSVEAIHWCAAFSEDTAPWLSGYTKAHHHANLTDHWAGVRASILAMGGGEDA